MLGITPARRQVLPDYQNVYQSGGATERRFSPYNDNGGTTVAVAGEDFVVVASDSRLTEGGYGILSRKQEKLFNLTPSSILASTGCWADVLTLTRLVQARIQMFKYTHNQTITTPATAQMLANMLYAKRFFPYYVRNILAGLDTDGKGVVYTYDPVGCMEKGVCGSDGAGVTIIQPLLDNQVEKRNMANVEKKPMKLEEAENLVHDCFIAAAERQISVGDAIIFRIITKKGIEEKIATLRRD